MIEELRKKGNVWRAVASDLDKACRNRIVVNLSVISRNTKKNDVVVVAGKVLGAGSISHPVIVGASGFSAGAKMLIEKANGRCLSIKELAMQYPDGKSVRVIG